MIYTVKSPILGFETTEKLEFTRVDEMFATVKDADREYPSFTLVNPYVLRNGYSFDIPMPISVLLDVKPDSKVNVYSILVVQQPIENSVVNFLAPLIFNEDNQTVAQVVLSSNEYPTFGVAEEIAEYLKLATATA